MSVPFETPGWKWPKAVDTNTLQDPPNHRDPFREDIHDPPGAFGAGEPEHHAEPEQDIPTQNDTDTPPRERRHYASRTCRICLEEVFPSFEAPREGVASMFSPAPKVSYISADASSGRLIRPCKCRGSQAYVHEGCLQDWRHADTRYGKRNYWECPTCGFKYRLERMAWSKVIQSAATQIIITASIMLLTVFLFGFIADPIINLYLDPVDTITSIPTGGRHAIQFDDDEEEGWTFHFIKGLASLGLLGFVKVFFAMSPWHWWNLRSSGFLGGGRRGGRGGGRERLENISWTIVIIGVLTFLVAVWTWVRAWTRRTLEKASERVVDVQGDDPDDDEEQPPGNPTATTGQSTSS